jgi:integrase
LADRVRSSPANWHALLLAAARMEAAGGCIDDLPEAAAEWAETHLAGASTPLSRAIEDHLADLAALNRAPSTRLNRRWRLGRMLAALGDRPLSRLSRPVLADWIASGGPPGSRRDRHAAASAFCRWVWERGLLPRNPMDGLRPPPRPPLPAPRILAPEEARRLLRAAAARDSALARYFAVGLFAGLRPVRELAGLDWTDVDLPARRLYVPCGRAKTGRARVVPVSPNLAAWLETAPPDQRTGPVVRFSRAAFRRVLADARIAWTPDLMRHSRVSYRLAQCGDPARVAAEGGHSPGVMLRHYANLRIAPADVSGYWSIVPEST